MSQIVLNPVQKEALKNAVKESVNSCYRMDAERDLKKEIATKICEELEIPKKVYNSLVKMAYKQDANKLNEEFIEILDLAEEIGIYSHKIEEGE